MVQLDLTNRRSLMASLPKGGVGVEIGVAEGIFSQLLLDVCQPEILYLVDPWLYQEKESLKDDASNVPQKVQRSRFEQVVDRYKIDSRIRIYRGFSLDVVKSFANRSLDWFHIDGDHTLAGRDLRTWWDKLALGGWATGHDYVMVGDHITVKDQVNAFAGEKGLEVFATTGACGDVYEQNYPSWAIQKPR